MSETALTLRSASIERAQPFDVLMEAALRQVATSSARVYRQTYAYWSGWCLDQQLDPSDLRPV